MRGGQTLSASIASKLATHPRALLLISCLLLFVSYPTLKSHDGSTAVTGLYPTSLSANCPKKGTRYGIMMDAGSTGSRTHVFEFMTGEDGRTQLIREVFEQLKPGLSSFKDDPEGGANSLLPLMQAAVREVPPELAPCTPIALKATAGLRLIGKVKADAILMATEKMMRRYPFFVGKDAAVVMDGRDEGPFAWLTVNFLLGALNAVSGATKGPKTAAIMDMGGASTQIVFQPDEAVALNEAPKEFVYGGSLQGKSFKTYQHSYLGFGLKQAQRRAMLAATKNGRADDFDCFPEGHSEEVPPGSDTPKNNAVTITNTKKKSNFESCRKFINTHVVTQDSCSIAPCSFGGIYQPPLSQSFTGPIYAFSYFHDRIEKFLGADGMATVGEFKNIGKKICEGAEEPYASHNKGTMCLDFSFLYSLLKDGYGLADTHELVIAKKIKGIEVAWPLGAMLVAME